MTRSILREGVPPALRLPRALPITIGSLALVATITFCLLLAGCGGGESAASWETSVFEPHLDEYLSHADARPAKGGASRVTGKALVIDVKRGQVDEGYCLALGDKGLLAWSPEEVRTLVFVRERGRKVGEYNGGSDAFVTRATITVVDLQKDVVVATRTFEGGLPPAGVEMGTDGWGSPPYTEVARYLRDLSRR